MIQRAPSRDAIPDEVVRRITSAITPWRIVLFGSRARGSAKEHSDYDFYVEIDADSEALQAIDSKIREACHGIFRLDFKLACRGDLERRRDDPGTIEWDVAREGKVLFADPAASRVLVPRDRVREPSPEPPESVREWVEAAEHDLRHHKFLTTSTGPDDYSPDMCWLSHQGAEKYMKALLVSRRVRPKRTHDLLELLAALRRAGCELQGLDADCALLTNHAIRPRYPSKKKLKESDARTAFEAVERLVSAVRAQLPPPVR